MSERSTVPAHRPLARSAPALAVGGLLVGCLTSFAQGWLPAPWDSLANSASPWLLVAWLVGYAQRTWMLGAITGLLTCAAEVVGYYATSAARDYGVSATFVAVWLVAGLLGGPLFGAAGQLTRDRSKHLAAVGIALPAAAFLGEGVGSYAIRLGYHDVAALFIATGIVLAVPTLWLTRHRLTTSLVVVGASVGALVVFGYALAVL